MSVQACFFFLVKYTIKETVFAAGGGTPIDHVLEPFVVQIVHLVGNVGGTRTPVAQQ